MTDPEFAQAQIRSLENECKALRETLRDRFAMAALTGLLSSQNFQPAAGLEALSQDTYRIADAMLEARK